MYFPLLNRTLNGIIAFPGTDGKPESLRALSRPESTEHFGERKLDEKKKEKKKLPVSASLRLLSEHHFSPI